MSSKHNLGPALCACSLLLAACGQASGHRLGGDVAGGPIELLRVGTCGKDADLELIEDMEDNNQAIKQFAGRSGSWFSFNDGTGMQSPPVATQLFPMARLEPARGTSTLAVHTYGSGFTTWGAGVGFELASTAPYDASGYAGIAFWARGAADVTQTVRVNVTDRNTSQFGSVCDLDCQADVGATESVGDGICMAERGPCHDYFGADFGSELTSEWHLFRYTWEQLRARNWSNKNLPGIVSSEVYGVRIQADSPDSFDFWLDDIAFICP
ncbi:MAG TPA: hypothetical protein VG937_19065 [Polyangiaceae bacterium]|jgi:hypothetical protein|nr:hypothetical protein [Polyangiaceae bacterium]